MMTTMPVPSLRVQNEGEDDGACAVGRMIISLGNHPDDDDAETIAVGTMASD